MITASSPPRSPRHAVRDTSPFSVNLKDGSSVEIATVGQPYRYQARSLSCLGDLQYRNAEPGYTFYERGVEVTVMRAWRTGRSLIIRA